MTLVSFPVLGLQHNPSRIPLWSGFTTCVSSRDRRAMNRAIAAIVADHQRLGRLIVSNGVASFSPGAFAPREVFAPYGPDVHDTAIDMGDGYNARDIRIAAAASGLTRVYWIDGTSVWVATDRRPVDLPHLGPLLIGPRRR